MARATITGDPDKGLVSICVPLKKGARSRTLEFDRKHVYVFGEMDKKGRLLSLELVIAKSRQAAVDASQIFA